MANSLAEQMLKAGLVDKKQVEKARKQSSKSKRANKAKKGAQVLSEAAQLAQKAAHEKAERDRELNRKREEERKAQEQRAQLHDFLSHAVIPSERGDMTYNFVVGSQIKHLYLSQEQHQGLSAGHLAITLFEGRHMLISLESLEKLRVLDPEHWYYRAEAQEAPGEDDPYAEFQVPDDLMW